MCAPRSVIVASGGVSAMHEQVSITTRARADEAHQLLRRTYEALAASRESVRRSEILLRISYAALALCALRQAADDESFF
jgi:hypothetical protein